MWNARLTRKRWPILKLPCVSNPEEVVISRGSGDVMGEWVLDWSLEEAELCWYNIWVLWSSEDLRANLTSNQIKYINLQKIERPSESEVVETVDVSVGGHSVRDRWLEV